MHGATNVCDGLADTGAATSLVAHEAHRCRDHGLVQKPPEDQPRWQSVDTPASLRALNRFAHHSRTGARHERHYSRTSNPTLGSVATRPTIGSLPISLRAVPRTSASASLLALEQGPHDCDGVCHHPVDLASHRASAGGSSMPARSRTPRIRVLPRCEPGREDRETLHVASQELLRRFFGNISLRINECRFERDVSLPAHYR